MSDLPLFNGCTYVLTQMKGDVPRKSYSGSLYQSLTGKVKEPEEIFVSIVMRASQLSPWDATVLCPTHSGTSSSFLFNPSR